MLHLFSKEFNLFKSNRLIYQGSEAPEAPKPTEISNRVAQMSDTQKKAISEKFFKKQSEEDREKIKTLLQSETGQKNLDPTKIVELQKKFNITEDGILGPNTLTKILELYTTKEITQQLAAEQKITSATQRPVVQPDAMRAFRQNHQEKQQELQGLTEQNNQLFLEKLLKVSTDEPRNEIDDSEDGPEHDAHAVKLPDFLQKASNDEKLLRRLIVQGEISTSSAIENATHELGIEDLTKIFTNQNVGTTVIHPDNILSLVELDFDSDYHKEILDSIDLRTQHERPPTLRQSLKTIQQKPTYDNLLKYTIELGKVKNKSPEQEKEYAQLSSTIKNIDTLLTAISDAREQKPTSYSPDYIEREQIQEANLDKLSSEQKLSLLAYLTIIYGSVNKLRDQGIITIDEEQKITINVDKIKREDPYYILIQTLIENEDGFLNINTGSTLTERVIAIQQNKDWQTSFTGYLNSISKGALLEKETQSDIKIKSLLFQLSPNSITFYTERGFIFTDREVLDKADLNKPTEAKSATGTPEAMSDKAFQEYLLSECREFTDQKVTYNYDKLIKKLALFHAMGKSVAILNPKYTKEEQEAIKNSEFAIEQPITLSKTDIELVKAGFKAHQKLEQNKQKSAAETAESGEEKQAIKAISDHLQLPETEVRRQLPTLLIGITEDGKIKPGIDLSKGFYLYKSQAGNLTISASGGLTSNDFKEVVKGEMFPVVKIQANYEGEHGAIGTGVSIGLATIGADINGSINFDENKQWKINAIAGGGLLAGLPYIIAGVGLERTIKGTLNSELSQTIKLNNGEFLPAEKIHQIVQGTMDQSQLLAIANQIPEITQITPEGSNISEENKNDIKVTFLQLLCEARLNENLKNSGGTVGFEFGLNVVIIGGIPVFIPRVGVELAIGTTTSYSKVVPSQALSEANEQELLKQLQKQNTTTNHKISLSSLDLTLSENGEIKIISPYQHLDNLTIPDTATSLNKHSTITGVNFTPTGNGLAMNFPELTDPLSPLSPEFHIYTDPELNIKVKVKGDKVVVLDLQGRQLPADFGIIRNEHIEATGSGRKIINIIFTKNSNGKTSKAIMEHQFSEGYISVNSTETKSVTSPYRNELTNEWTKTRDQASAPDPYLISPPSTEALSADSQLRKHYTTKTQEEQLNPTEESFLQDLILNEDFLTEYKKVSSTLQQDPEATFQAVNQFLKEVVGDNNHIRIDQIQQQLMVKLQPGSVTRLDRLKTPQQKMKAINKVTQLVKKSLEEHPAFQSKTDAEKKAIIHTLITGNIVTNPDLLDNLDTTNFNLGPDTLAATYTRFKNEQDKIQTGLRPFLFSNLAQGSHLKNFPPKHLNPNEQLDQAAISFIKDLFAPEPESPEDYANSLMAKKLATMTMRINGDQVSILTAIYGDDIKDIQDFIANPTNLPQSKTIEHFQTLITQLHKAQNGATINLVTYPNNYNIGQLKFTETAGSYFIDTCGNLSFFYNFELSAQLNTSTTEVVAGSVRTQETLQGNTNVNTVGLAAAGPISGETPDKTGEPPSETPPPETEKKAEAPAQ